MPLDSAFLLEVKEHVTAKLKNLGAFIDEELPDYIMVMVANNKSQSSMAEDLQLFLGDHTQDFTKWLHSTLEKLKSRGSEKSKSKAKNLESSSTTKSKPTRRKSTKEERSTRTARSRSRSPINRKPVSPPSSREPHDFDTFSLTVDDYTVDDDISSSVPVKEERKVVSTASLVPKSRSESQVASVDSTQENSSLRSVVKVRESEIKQRPKINKPEANSLKPTGRLLKQAVSEVKANCIRQPQNNFGQSRTKHTTNVRSVEYGDVSSSDVYTEKTKFFVTLSGAELEPSAALEMDSAPRLTPRTGGPISNVKSRLGSRRVLPYEIPSKLSAKQRLGPLAGKRSLAEALMDEPEFDDLDMVQEVDISEEPISPSADSRTVGLHKVQLADRLNQKQLVVSLNDADDDDDLAPLAPTGIGKKQQGSPSDKTTSADGPAKIPSTLERCRYWPKCRNGDQCSYIHPSEPCTTFPRCRLGDECIYIHPTCRYDASCTRPDCPFSHSVKKTVKPIVPTPPLVTPAQVVCRYQDRCTNAFCPFYHPPVARLPTVRPPSASIPCRFGAKCVNTSCPFIHSTCPTPNQLKWVAPSKRSQQQQQNADDSVKTLATAVPVVAKPTTPVK